MITLTVVIVFGLPGRQLDPVLVFAGYSSVPTNATRIANFELRNASHRAIWLSYGGREFPLAAPLLERHVGVPTKANSSQWNISASIGSYFEEGKRVLPGRSLLLEFPLVSGQPASQVGVAFYVGNFNDGNDFLGNLGIPLLDLNANLRDKAAFYCEKLKRSFRSAERHEVWCPQIVCFEDAASQIPTVHHGACLR